VVYSDINSVYFAVNRFHRASPKCAWLMNDVAYEQVANAVDGNGRPLINIVEDQEMLKGKPVYISPSLPASGAGSFCIFGDLSHVYVRLSQMILTRNWQLPGYVENGQALYTGYMRADAKVFDPTAGNTQPIVAATLHS
jgi:HK97 family phage major capsid protein